MLNFNNTLTSKIISLIIAVSFLMTDISYAGAFQEGLLRVPVGEKRTSNRMEELIRKQAAVQLAVSPPKLNAASLDATRGFRTTFMGKDVYVKGMILDKTRTENLIKALNLKTSDGQQVVPELIQVYFPDEVLDLEGSVVGQQLVLKQNIRASRASRIILESASKRGLFPLTSLDTVKAYLSAGEALNFDASYQILNLLSEGNIVLYAFSYGGETIDQFMGRNNENHEINKRVASQLGKNLATFHKAWLIADDPHPWQFVVSPDGSAVLRVDLDNIWSLNRYPSAPDVSFKRDAHAEFLSVARYLTREEFKVYSASYATELGARLVARGQTEGTGETGSETAEQSETVAVSSPELTVVPTQPLVNRLDRTVGKSI